MGRHPLGLLRPPPSPQNALTSRPLRRDYLEWPSHPQLLGPEATFYREEYVHLRIESLDAIKHRSQIIAFGLAGVGVTFAGTLSLEPVENPQAAMLVLNAGVPAGLILAFAIWLGEFERMMRAGNFLTVLEATINGRLGSDVLHWEQWLRGSGSQMRYPYVAAGGILLGPVAAIPIVGIQVASVSFEDYWFAWVIPIVAFVVVLVAAALRLRTLARQSQWALAIATAGRQSVDGRN